MSNTRRAWLTPLTWSLTGIIAVVILFRINDTAREIFSETAVTVLQVLTTPFIMEASLALLGLCVVMAINRYRELKEGDEWVYLEQKAASADKTAADDPPHRHEAVVWREKPAPFDAASTALEVVEGYLELGLTDDALRELSSLNNTSQANVRADWHRVRALAMSGRQQEAMSELEHAVSTHPLRREGHADIALKIAVWLHDNQKPRAEIAAWMQRCCALDEAVLGQLPAGHPLHRAADN